MPTVVGVRLRFSKTLWFDPAGAQFALGDLVVVSTERGTEIGTVTQAPHEVDQAQLAAALKPVLRAVTDEDLARVEELEGREREAMATFRQLVMQHKLDMKPVDVEYLLDGDKIVFYFSAEERVDFRDLVRDLASRFHARIDMRQVGVRDEARAVGGVGHCGQPLCCVRFGGEFQPVSIRMAKEQDLPLNPLKISGLCGRLMCCLRYEFDAYKDYKSRAPRRGAMVETPEGTAKVTDLNTPKETVTVRMQDGTNVTVPLASMSCSKGSGCPCSIDKAAIEAAKGPAVTAVSAQVSRVLEESSPEEAAAVSGPKGPAPRPKKDEQRAGSAGGESTGRRRRRRSKPGGKSSAEAAQPSAQGQSQQPAKARPERAKQGERQQQAGQETLPGRVPRRRRRKRPETGGDAAQ